jgi:eukaryotic-like serine/threonine-protein kinase
MQVATRHPEKIGKYQIEEFLGGGMSHVYRATDSVLGRRVAIKLLTDEAMADPEARDRFLQEARLASNIQHENIIAIYDFGEDQVEGGQVRPYMVMEFVEGESLRTAIEGGRAGDIPERLRIARQAAKALEHIHTRKVIHRDIKPENIHIDRMGKVRLMDFGIASATGVNDSKTGKTAGTPFYMSPEQVLGVDVTIQADIYSFGIVLYELFTGKKPFQGAKVEEIFEQILHNPVDTQPLIDAAVPARVIGAIQRCTSKKLIERPATLAPVVEDLTSAASDNPAPRPVEPAPIPGLLSPSAQRPPSEVRLTMPPPPDPSRLNVTATQNATGKPASSPGKMMVLVVLGAITVALVIFAVTKLSSN